MQPFSRFARTRDADARRRILSALAVAVLIAFAVPGAQGQDCCPTTTTVTDPTTTTEPTTTTTAAYVLPVLTTTTTTPGRQPSTSLTAARAEAERRHDGASTTWLWAVAVVLGGSVFAVVRRLDRRWSGR